MLNRPILKISLTPVDKALEIFGWFTLAVLWCFTIYSYSKLPDIIPIHFNAHGQVNGRGSKATIFILPVIASIVFAGMTILNKYPHIFNYPANLTNENALRQYTNATSMLRYIKSIIVVIFLLIVLFTYWTAIGKTSGLGVWFVPLTFVMIACPTIYFVVKSYR